MCSGSISFYQTLSYERITSVDKLIFVALRAIKEFFLFWYNCWRSTIRSFVLSGNFASQSRKCAIDVKTQDPKEALNQYSRHYPFDFSRFFCRVIFFYCFHSLSLKSYCQCDFALSIIKSCIGLDFNDSYCWRQPFRASSNTPTRRSNITYFLSEMALHDRCHPSIFVTCSNDSI